MKFRQVWQHCFSEGMSTLKRVSARQVVTVNLDSEASALFSFKWPLTRQYNSC